MTSLNHRIQSLMSAPGTIFPIRCVPVSRCTVSPDLMFRTGFVELSQYPSVEVFSLQPRMWTFPVVSTFLTSTARAFGRAISLKAKVAPAAPTYFMNSRRSMPSPLFLFFLPSLINTPWSLDFRLGAFPQR